MHRYVCKCIHTQSQYSKICLYMYAGICCAVVHRALRVRSKRFASKDFFAGLPQALESLLRSGKHGSDPLCINGIR